MRLLFVTPRYGDLAGGAENLTRALVERCCDGWEVEVATTCARDHFTWRNELPAGAERIDGALVRRFSVSVTPPPGGFPAASGGYLGSVRRLARSVWSVDLHRFLVREGSRFDLVLFAPYLFGTTFWGAQVDPDRTVLIPCLHDEPEARLEPMRSLFRRVRGLIFNTDAERRLAEALYGVQDGDVVGIGVDPPGAPADVEGFRRRHGLEGPYLVYCGRLEEGKRVDVLVKHVVERNRGAADPVTLVLVGSGGYRPPGDASLRLLGFLDEDEKRAAYAGAVAFVTASELESLSITLLEAWREGTPALVAAGSDVLLEHALASGGAIPFWNQVDFDAGVTRVLDEGERLRLGQAGRAYVEKEYAWDAVRVRFRSAVERLAV